MSLADEELREGNLGAYQERVEQAAALVDEALTLLGAEAATVTTEPAVAGDSAVPTESTELSN